MCHYLIGTGLFECESLALAGVPQGREGVVDVLRCEEARHSTHQPLPGRLQGRKERQYTKGGPRST